MKLWLVVFLLFATLPPLARADIDERTETFSQTIWLHSVVMVGGTTVGIANSYPGVLYSKEKDSERWQLECHLMFEGIGIDALEADPENSEIRFLGFRVPDDKQRVWVRWTFPPVTPFRGEEIFDTMPADFGPIQSRYDQVAKRSKWPEIKRNR